MSSVSSPARFVRGRIAPRASSLCWTAAASLLLAIPSTAALADPNCPPGNWFCEETPVTPPPQQADPDDNTPEQGAPNENTPPPADAPKKHKKHKAAPQVAPDGTTQLQTTGQVQIQAQGPVVIYTQNGQQVVTPGAPPPPPPPASGPRLPPPQVARRPWREHFGLNLRAEGAGFSAADGSTAGMGGLGLSMRWRPAPAFALDAGLDIMGGNDYYANSRIETAVSLTGMIFFNPKSIFQIYMLGGFHVAHAEISTNTTLQGNSLFSNDTSSRDYIGLHGGLGVEWRVGKHVGLDLDGVGILRTGIGNGSPEFTNPKTGQTSDTSGAGMGRAGVTFWW